MGTNRISHARAQLLDELGLLVVSHLDGRRRPRKPTQVSMAIRPDQHVAGRQLPDLAEDRQRCGNRVERQERLDRIEVDLAAR